MIMEINFYKFLAIFYHISSFFTKMHGNIKNIFDYDLFKSNIEIQPIQVVGFLPSFCFQYLDIRINILVYVRIYKNKFVLGPNRITNQIVQKIK